jgi:hypothetical protein
MGGTGSNAGNTRDTLPATGGANVIGSGPDDGGAASPMATAAPALPDWASQTSGAGKFAGIAGGAGSTPMANLGFPTSGDPQGFNHALLGDNNTGLPTGNNNTGTSVGAVGGPAGPTGPAEDPNARVAVYLPGGGFGFGTSSGMFGSTGTNTYQQRSGPNGSTQPISNPYGISIEGVDSMNDPWQQRQARELGWLDPKSYEQDTTMQWQLGQSGVKPTPMAFKPGDTVAAGTKDVPTMSKALYDWNMKVYGNPYGAGYNQQYIGGPTPTPTYPGDHL